MEIWKKIKGFNNYSVSNLGNIRRDEYYIKDSIGRNQYKPKKIARLVRPDEKRSLLWLGVNEK